jgi:hypothetical protein
MHYTLNGVIFKLDLLKMSKNNIIIKSNKTRKRNSTCNHCQVITCNIIEKQFEKQRHHLDLNLCIMYTCIFPLIFQSIPAFDLLPEFIIIASL